MADTRAVIFDVDGTLIDTNDPKPIIEIARAEKFPVPDDIHERFHTHAGLPGTRFLQECFGVCESDARRLYGLWEERDAAHSIPFIEGACDVIQELANKNYMLCILTSRHRTSLTPILKTADILHLFVDITAHEDTDHHKPDPRAFRKITRALRSRDILHTSEMLYIGDTKTDLEAGTAAGIPTVIVETGSYAKQRHLLEHDSNFIIPSVAHLPDWLKRHRVPQPA